MGPPPPLATKPNEKVRGPGSLSHTTSALSHGCAYPTDAPGHLTPQTLSVSSRFTQWQMHGCDARAMSSRDRLHLRRSKGPRGASVTVSSASLTHLKPPSSRERVQRSSLAKGVFLGPPRREAPPDTLSPSRIVQDIQHVFCTDIACPATSRPAATGHTDVLKTEGRSGRAASGPVW